MHRCLSLVFAFCATSLLFGQSGARMNLTSTSFASGGSIPKKYTCDAEDNSPALSWNGAPPVTKSFVLIADDPDAPAGTWTHWMLFDLPSSTSSLSENVSKVDQPPSGGKQGRNDFGKTGYGGPCPPPGSPHHYHFALYALNAKLDLKPGASRAQVEQAMKGRVVAGGELVGTYGRR